jgi:hypothetical protein
MFTLRCLCLCPSLFEILSAVLLLHIENFCLNVCHLRTIKTVSVTPFISYKSRTAAIDVCLTLNFPVVFDFYLFLVLASKAK